MALEDDAGPDLWAAPRTEEPGPGARQDHGIAPPRAFALAAYLDRGALGLVLTAKSLLSNCLAGLSEILAQAALRAEPHLTGRARGIGQRNHLRLRALLDRYPDLFDPDEPGNLSFACPRFRGREGATAFARTLASEDGVLVLPSALWHSPLASIPTDRLRLGLGLGRVRSGAALGILADHLLQRACR